MSYNKHQFGHLITRTLIIIGRYSVPARDLLLGTAAQESGFGTYLRQLGNGPALGTFQVEPETFRDVIARGHSKLPFPYSSAILGWDHEELEWDLKKSIIICRLKYLLCPGQIPDDLAGQAAYWKQWYNTPLGSGTVDEYLENYRKYVE